jgi:hypothetical protein
MARFVADGFAVQAENRESLAGACPSVSFFSTFEHDPFVWSECATEGHAGVDHRCISPSTYRPP